MRDESGDWLEPMFTEAQKRPDIDIHGLMRLASMPAAEADTPLLDRLAKNTPTGAHVSGMDWVRFGQLLRHELGWDDTYPAFPDFPEARDVL